jgi:hypothetical protein
MSNGYNGNQQLKKVDEPIKWESKLIKEYEKCRDDVLYFGESYCKIISVDDGIIEMKAYNYQKNVLKAIDENRNVICRIGRQQGKTTILVIYLLHYILFNENKTIGILAHKKAGAIEVLDRIKISFELLPKFLQQGVLEWNKGNIHVENGSKIITSASSGTGLRGKSISCLFIDEIAHIPNNQWDEFWASTYPVISSGKKTKTIAVSTPNGLNHFYKIWMDAKSGGSSFAAVGAEWHDHPDRDEEFKRNTIEDIGQKRWMQEYECNFLGSSNTLINLETLESFVSMSQYKMKDNTHIYKEAKEDNQYFLIADVSYGKGQDYSTFSVFDISEYPYEQVAVYKQNDISPIMFPQVIAEIGKYYNDAFVLIESNDIGHITLNGLNYDIEYPNIISETVRDLGMRMTKKVKSIGCATLKDLLENRLIIINDESTIQELYTFVINKNSYAADIGKHDDLVMNLVLMSYFISTPQFEDLSISEKNYKNNMYVAQQQELMSFYTIGNMSDDSDEFSW